MHSLGVWTPTYEWGKRSSVHNTHQVNIPRISCIVDWFLHTLQTRGSGLPHVSQYVLFTISGKGPTMITDLTVPKVWPIHGNYFVFRMVLSDPSALPSNLVNWIWLQISKVDTLGAFNSDESPYECGMFLYLYGFIMTRNTRSGW